MRTVVALLAIALVSGCLLFCQPMMAAAASQQHDRCPLQRTQDNDCGNSPPTPSCDRDIQLPQPEKIKSDLPALLALVADVPALIALPPEERYSDAEVPARARDRLFLRLSVLRI